MEVFLSCYDLEGLVGIDDMTLYDGEAEVFED